MITNTLLFAALSLFYYVNQPVVNMRAEPNGEAEIVSQAFYSESIIPLEDQTDWMKIETQSDHYQGWIKKEAFIQREAYLKDPSKCLIINRCAAHLYDKPDTIFGAKLTLPFESKLEALEDFEGSQSRWIKIALVDGSQGHIQRGDIAFPQKELTPPELCAFSLRFLNLPYTWGGRSSFGYDCSGFSQMLYRQMGISLPRDSKDQVNWSGFKEVSLNQLQPGDLLFFGLTKDQIRHVAMCLENNQFIHATVLENAPYIHISNLLDAEWNGNGKYKFVTARRLKD